MRPMNIVELHTGLFPDAPTLAAALSALRPEHRVARIDVSPIEQADEVWDRALCAILASDLVVVT